MAITDIYFSDFEKETKPGNIWTGFINVTDFIINEDTAITRVIFSNEDGESVNAEGIGAYSGQNAVAVLVPPDIEGGKYDIAVGLVNKSNPQEQFICSTPSFDIDIQEEKTDDTPQINSVKFLRNGTTTVSIEQLNNHEQIVVTGEKLDTLLAVELTLLPSMMTLITELSDTEVIASIITIPPIVNLPLISRIRITYCVKDTSGQVIETKFLTAPNTIKIVE